MKKIKIEILEKKEIKIYKIKSATFITNPRKPLTGMEWERCQRMVNILNVLPELFFLTPINIC